MIPTDFDPNQCFECIVTFVILTYKLGLAGKVPSIEVRRQAIDLWFLLSTWTDEGGEHPLPIVRDGKRFSWNPASHEVEVA